MENYDNLSVEKLYDSIFWTGINMLKPYVPMLVNEVFGKHFTKNATVTLLPGKETVEQSDETFAERNTDSMFVLSETL